MYQYDGVDMDKTVVTEKKRDNATQEGELYVVAKGDTLYSISKKYNIPVEELKKQNKIFDNANTKGQSIINK